MYQRSTPRTGDDYYMRSIGKDNPAVLDPSALNMRVATFGAGVWLSYVVCATSAIYITLTWQLPNRAALAVLFGTGIAAAAVVAQLPRERIVRSRFREAFFLTWSLLDLALIALAALADGGTGSPVALVFFIPVVFAAMSYPLWSVALVGSLTVASYLTLAVTVGGAPWAYQATFAVMLTCTGAMSAWQARNHARQSQTLMQVSRTDPLTGCLNRRGFEERALGEIGATGRRAGQGAVLVLDVDRLKLVNDRQGHAAGDELLREVVRTLECTVRPTDAIGRIGGDEFAVLFADIEPIDALESATRITSALNARSPCSIGLASFPAEGSEFEELLREADSRLYDSRRHRLQRGRAGGDERLESFVPWIGHSHERYDGIG